MSFSVVIPSRNIDNLVPCVEAVRRCEPEANIIVARTLKSMVRRVRLDAVGVNLQSGKGKVSIS